jgi:hypothetical protein
MDSVTRAFRKIGINQMKTRVYVQSEFLSDVKLVEVNDDTTIEDLKKACLSVLPPEANGVDLRLFAEDEGEETNATHVKHLKKPHGVRVHLHRCKKVDVAVRFAGRTESREFQPATTIGHIRQWAGHKLGMQPNDIAEHVLQLAGSTTQPDIDVHVGTLAKGPACAVEFDLVPAHRING